MSFLSIIVFIKIIINSHQVLNEHNVWMKSEWFYLFFNFFFVQLYIKLAKESSSAVNKIEGQSTRDYTYRWHWCIVERILIEPRRASRQLCNWRSRHLLYSRFSLSRCTLLFHIHLNTINQEPSLTLYSLLECSRYMVISPASGHGITISLLI